MWGESKRNVERATTGVGGRGPRGCGRGVAAHPQERRAPKWNDKDVCRRGRNATSVPGPCVTASETNVAVLSSRTAFDGSPEQGSVPGAGSSRGQTGKLSEPGAWVPEEEAGTEQAVGW